MIQSFYNGFSGVKTQQFGVDSWSNNIANVNTNGYRASTPEFENIFTTSLVAANASSPNCNTQGYGVTVSSNKIDTSMGSLVNAYGSDFNMALSGDRGWFIVGNQVGGTTNQFYTRDGGFSRDASGSIVNANGEYLYGVDLNKIANNAITPRNDLTADINTLKTASTLSPLTIPEDLRYPPQQTTFVNSAVNLNPTSSLKPTSTANLLNANLNTIYGDNKSRLKTGTEQLVINSVDVAGVRTPTVIDLTNMNTMQDLIDGSNGIIGVDGSNLTFTNAAGAGTTLEIDYANSSQNLLGALGISANQSIAEGSSFKSGALTVPNTTLNSKVYDAQGNEYNLKADYILNDKTNAGESWKLTTGIYDTAGNLVSDEVSGSLNFTGSSANNTPTLLDSNGADVNSLSITNFTGGAITYNPKEFTDEFGNRQTSTNVYSFSENMVSSTDGSAEGFLDNVNIDANGIISVNFNNAKSEVFGRVGVANFQNPQGLKKLGGNIFEATANSGNGLTNWNSDGVLKSTSLIQHKLETSNVKMDTALTQLMIMQRAYSASTKSISTADEMVKEAIGLKR